MCALDIRPAIGTERLVLRGPTPADAAGLAGACDVEAFLQQCEALDPRLEPRFAIEHRQFGVVGMLGFRAGQTSRPEVTCWMDRPFRGRGYATEALNAALAWAREDWGKGAVWAGHCVDNPAAAEVLVKAGFLYTGDVERRACPARGGEPTATRMMVWLA